MEAHLLEIPSISNVRFLDSQISSVSTKWGVAWNEFAICRDYIQNFYDQSQMLVILGLNLGKLIRPTLLVTEGCGLRIFE